MKKKDLDDILKRVIKVIRSTGAEYVGSYEKGIILLRLESEFYDDMKKIMIKKNETK